MPRCYSSLVKTRCAFAFLAEFTELPCVPIPHVSQILAQALFPGSPPYFFHLTSVLGTRAPSNEAPAVSLFKPLETSETRHRQPMPEKRCEQVVP